MDTVIGTKLFLHRAECFKDSRKEQELCLIEKKQALILSAYSTLAPLPSHQ